MAESLRKRKAHLKSRKGCSGCKRRHQKCGEEHPRCKECTRLGVSCSFEDVSHSNSASSPAQSASFVQSPSQDPSLFDQCVNIIDLELLHNFTSRLTTDVFPDGDMKKSLIQQYVELALSRPFLLHMALAVSALNIYLDKPNRQELLYRASYLQAEALREVNSYLGGFSEDDSIPVLFFSGLTAIYSLAEGAVEARNRRRAADFDPISKILSCFSLVRGIRAVLTPFYGHVLNSWAGPMFKHNISSGAESDSLPPAGSEQHTMLKSLAFGLENDENRRSCLEAIDRLFRYIQILSHEDYCHNTQLSTRLVQSWIMDLDSSIEDLMRQRKPVALIMLAYYAVLIKISSGTWWARQWPVVILDEVSRNLNDDWRGFLKWPNDKIRDHPENTAEE